MTITQIGLICDIIGALIIFYFGIPQKPQETESYVDQGDLTEAQKRKNRTVRTIAYIGLFLLLLGFVFQLIGTTQKSV